MGFFDLFFKANVKDKLPFSKTISFERIESNLDINLGDEPKIWNKPDSNQLNLYSKGSVGGNGLIGIGYNSTISYHIQNTKYLFIETKIVGLNRNQIDLYINIFVDKETVLEQQANHKSNWIESVQKKYKPKANWELRFFSKIQIKDTVKIKTISKDMIAEYYAKTNEAIWLTDDQGVKIEAENNIRNGGTEKTLRAVFSGHELEIKRLKKEDYWYYLEVGIKE